MLFLILLPSAAARVCIVVPGSWSPRSGVLVSAARACKAFLRLKSYHHHIRHTTHIAGCCSVNLIWCAFLRLQSYHHHIHHKVHHTIISLPYTGVFLRLWGLGFRVSCVRERAREAAHTCYTRVISKREDGQP
jgi:hypothetical protein